MARQQPLTMPRTMQKDNEPSRLIEMAVTSLTGIIIYVFNAETQRNEVINPNTNWVLGHNEAAWQQLVAEPLKLMHPDDRARLPAHFERLAADLSTKLHPFEYRMRHADGSWRWFLGRERALERGADGRLHKLLGIATDITEHKTTEERLRNSEDRFRSLVELSSDWYWEQDEHFRFIDISSGNSGQEGLESAPYLGKTRWELPAVDRNNARWAAHRTMLERREPFRDFEYQWTRKEGDFLWVSVSGDPIFDKEGRFKGYRGTGRNITRRKQVAEALRESEERLRLSIEAAGLGTFAVDLKRNVVHYSPELSRILGFPGTHVVPVELAFSRVHRDDVDRIRKQYITALNPAGDGRLRMEMRFVRPGGEVRWMTFNGEVKFRGEPNRRVPRQIVGACVDITDRKRAEELLSRTNVELEARVAERTRQLEQEMQRREEAQAALAQAQRMEAVGQLAGGIAHDANNMLTVIYGNLERAMSFIEDDKARRPLQQALDAVEMGASLNRRLLSFARQRKLEPERLSLNDRVVEMMKLLQRSIGEQISLVTRLASEPWKTKADPGEIDNALLNLALNARDAMQGGGSLTIETRNVTLDAASASDYPDARPGDYVLLRLTDTGHGMTPEVLSRAIEPFFTTKPAGKGSGLGLSSVYGFAKQSGGFLSISSVVECGTTVDVYLPRVAAGTAATMANAMKEGIPLGDGELILVVEDQDQVRELALSRLESLGYAVLEARNGPEAIKLLEAGEPVSLVFSDVVMPGGMTGYDIARWVHATKSKIKVLLTSGYNDLHSTGSEDDQSLKVLSKPYSREQLALSVHQALNV
jgi:PAS domain S-box-containing protein